MIVNPWLLPFVLLLLWFPRQWLRRGKTMVPSPRLRKAPPARPRRDLSLRAGEEFFKFRNWIDLLRSAVGSWALVNACFEVADDAPKSTATNLVVVKACVLMIAMVVQTLRWDRRDPALVAPVFFAMGAGFGVVGPLAAPFACVMAWTLNGALPSAGMFLCVLGVMQTGFAILLREAPVSMSLLAGALTTAPVWLALLTQRRLERTVRLAGAGPVRGDGE